MTVAQLIKILQTLDQRKKIYCTEVAFHTPELQKVGSVELETSALTGIDQYVIYGDQQ